MGMNERLFRVTEAAKELNIAGEDVLLLIRSGELHAGKGQDGRVYVPERALRDYEERRKTGASQ